MSDKKHITLIVPFVPFNVSAMFKTHQCVDSFRNKVDRIILIQNGMELPEDTVVPLADVVIKEPFNILMAGAINRGFLESKKFDDTEFLCFANNDTADGNIDFNQLCERGCMRSPSIAGQHAGYGAHASFFVIHKGF